MHIYPSLMAADPKNLHDEIDLLEPYCAGFHLDVMDNKFVPNSALSIETVNDVAQRGKPVWVHLMVENPDEFYTKLLLPDDSIVSFHIESEIDVARFVKIIREKKQRPSIAIRPKTPLDKIFQFCDIVDQVLVMSVEPGFSGQHFLPNSISRLEELVAYRKKSDVFFSIGIDGGINKDNIKMVAEKGVDDCAIASGIFKQSDHLVALHELEEVAR
ncbi:MAG TPA: ribulose-phosphate 3-epimerase [Candidatus Babeliales bacterium]|nr:ribulose-phosphate 3-epimerase [Candidatus Babeliales bacterium]